jgi:hypothetical protein
MVLIYNFLIFNLCSATEQMPVLVFEAKKKRSTYFLVIFLKKCTFVFKFSPSHGGGQIHRLDRSQDRNSIFPIFSAFLQHRAHCVRSRVLSRPHFFVNWRAVLWKTSLSRKQGDQIGRIFFEKYKSTQKKIFRRKSNEIILAKNGLGYILEHFLHKIWSPCPIRPSISLILLLVRLLFSASSNLVSYDQGDQIGRNFAWW